MTASRRAASIFALTLTLSCALAHADPLSRQVDFNIASQRLAAAIIQFSEQAHVQVISSGVDVTDQTTPGVIGRYSVADALNALLKGTGLRYKAMNEDTVSLQADRQKPGSSQTQLAQQSTLALAQTDPVQNSRTSGADALSSSASIPPDSDKSRLDEIIVTAQKRPERLLDVPVSIVVVTADDLQKRNIVTLSDLAMAVPGMFVQNAGSYSNQIFLRGISNVFGTSSQIGLYVDEADVTSGGATQPDIHPYDLQRVEVLRGPQGTLYGDGSLGGTIRFITNSPSLNGFSVKADVATLFTQDGGPSQRIQEAVNIPLIDDVLAIRVAGLFDHEGGWINQPAANQTNINDQNIADVRTKVLWQPTQQFSVAATAEIHRNNEGQSSGEDADGNYTQVFGLTTTPHTVDSYDLYNLTLTYDFPVARLLNTTSYIDQENESHNFGSFVYDTAFPGPPTFELYEPLLSGSEQTLSDELRLTSVGTGPWQWTIGTFYRHFKTDEVQTLYFSAPGPLPTTPFTVATNGSSSSKSVFGDTSYKIADRFTIGAGIRDYTDDQDFFNGIAQSARFHSVDPRFYVNLKVMDQVSIYASAAKGFRSGGFNSNPASAPYGPESVWTYEAGIKMLLLDGRLSIDSDIFYSKYQDYVTVGVPPLPALPLNAYQNAGTAKIKGFEWNAKWRPIDQWTLSFNGNYLDSYFTQIELTPISAAYEVGDPLDYTPKYQGTASVQRDFEWSDKSGFARLDFNAQGRMNFRNRSVGPFFFSQSDVIHMLNFNSGLDWSQNLSFGLFAQNLLNDRGYTTPDVIEQGAIRSRPRTYGVNFGVKF